MVDHAIFYYPKVMRIWRMVDLLYRINLIDNATLLFLKSLKLSLDSKMARIQGE